MVDEFKNRAPGLESPLENGAEVAPDDASDLDNITRALWVGVSGDIKVTLKGGSTVTLANAFGLLPLRVTRVWDTDTAATNIVALW